MTWQLLIFISILSYAFSVILQKTILKDDDNDPIAFSILFQLVVGVVTLLVAVAFQQISFVGIEKVWQNLLLMTVLYGVGGLTIFYALRGLEASKFIILLATRGIVTIFASSVLLHEGLTNIQLAGTACILAAILWVHGKGFKITFSKFEIFALITAVCFGLGTTNDRFILQSMSTYTYIPLAFFLPAFFVAAVQPQKVKEIIPLLRWCTFKKMFLLGVIYAVSAITFFLAYDAAPNSAQVTSVNLSQVVFIVLLSIVLLKERQRMLTKLGAAVLTLFGLLLLR